MKYVRYVAGLSDADLSILSGVGLPGVRKFLLKSDIDRDFDKMLVRCRAVDECRRMLEKEGKHVTAEEIHKILEKRYKKGYSLNSVKKYLASPERRPGKNRNARTYLERQTMFASVSDDDRAILRTIQKRYLPDESRFDCDLTFGKGDFYRYGIEFPKHCFDKYPQRADQPGAPAVYGLDEVDGRISNDSLASVVIDLPQSIGTKDGFKDLHDLAISYYVMLRIAHDKLRLARPGVDGGILVVKAGDIQWKGKRLWMAKIVTDMATGNETMLSREVFDELRKELTPRRFHMQLIDKFVHTYSNEEVGKDNGGKHSVKAHDNYLVFRMDPKEYEVVYAADDKERKDFYPTFHLRKDSPNYQYLFAWGRKVYKRPLKSEDAIRVTRSTPMNHLTVNQKVDGHLARAIENKFDIKEGSLEGLTGDRLLNKLVMTMKILRRDMGPVGPFVMEVCNRLWEMGVEYIEWPELGGMRVYFNS